MSESGPGMARCDGCGRSDIALRRIESGQRLCRACAVALKTARPRNLATQRQLEYARMLGFDVHADISRMALEKLLTLHRDVRFYVFDVWREMTGEGPRDSGVSVMEAMHFVTWLVTSRRRLALRVSHTERVRERLAKQERDRLIAKLGPDTQIDMADIKPRPLHDQTYRVVAELLRRKLGSDTCKFGILSSLITKRASSDPTGRKRRTPKPGRRRKSAGQT